MTDAIRLAQFDQCTSSSIEAELLVVPLAAVATCCPRAPANWRPSTTARRLELGPVIIIIMIAVGRPSAHSAGAPERAVVRRVTQRRSHSSRRRRHCRCRINFVPMQIDPTRSGWIWRMMGRVIKHKRRRRRR
jgi:hypothetical protein